MKHAWWSARLAEVSFDQQSLIENNLVVYKMPNKEIVVGFSSIKFEKSSSSNDISSAYPLLAFSISFKLIALSWVKH